MKVSVICVADRKELLPCLYWSLVAQTYKNWEFIILDQTPVIGSAADHIPWVADDRVRYYRVEHMGDWGQFMKDHAAHHIAIGDVFMFPADDAYYVPAALSVMCGALIQQQSDIVVCGWLYDVLGYRAMPPSIEQGFVDIGGFMVRKEAFLRADWSDKSQIGDYKLLQSIIDTGAKLAYHPSILYVKN